MDDPKFSPSESIPPGNASDRLPPDMLQAILVGELETLFQVSQVLSRSLDLQSTLSSVLEVLDQRVGLARGLVGLVPPERDELMIYAVRGMPELAAGEVRYQSGEGVVGEILRQGESLVLSRITDDSRFLGRLGIYDLEKPFIGVPIRSGSEVLGVLAA
jgi:Nif-specific regulatory protein